MLLQRSFRCFVTSLFCVGILLMACQSIRAEEKKAKSADKPKQEKAEKQKAEKEVDPFAVPDGTPDELLKYLKSLRRQRPKALDRKSVTEFRDKLFNAIEEAATKVMAGKPTKDQAREAMMAKVGLVMQAVQMGDPEASAKVKAVIDELKKADLPDMVKEVRARLLQDELRQARAGGKEAMQKVIEKIQALLSERPLQPKDSSLAMMSGYTVESLGDKEFAAATYRGFAKLFAASKDKEVVKIGASLEGAARRVTIIGNEMLLEGVTMDGKPFDWSKYKGKTVLVDFWATWCGPCIHEIPNIRKNYDLYHEKGFDVVAISLDRDRKRLESFLEKEKPPWTVLHDRAEGRKPEKSMSTYYGIIGIPSLFLIDKEGKVVSTSVRGPALREELTKLLGPVEEPKEDKKDDEKKDK